MSWQEEIKGEKCLFTEHWFVIEEADELYGIFRLRTAV